MRNLDDDLIARLKRRAARHGRSTEAEHREILRQALIGDVEPSFDTLAADLLVAGCANIFWKKVQSRELLKAEALLGARLFQGAEIELLPTRSLFN